MIAAAAPLPQLSLKPEKLLLDGPLGSKATITRDIEVSGIVGGGSSAYSASIQSGSEWLLVGNVVSGTTVTWGASVSGALPGNLRIFARLSGLTAGIHSGSVAVSTPGSEAPTLLPITLNVRRPPSVSLRPTTLSFSHQAQNIYNQPPAQTLSVFGGNSRFTTHVSTDTGGGWLFATPLSSTSPSDISVSVVPAGLAAGFYQGTITILSPEISNAGVVATVTLTVTDDSEYVAVPGSISLEAKFGSHQPVSAGLSLYTNGYALPTVVRSLNAAWLSMTSLDSWAGTMDGKTQMMLPVPARARVYADPTDLPVGTYTSSIVVGDEISNISIPVSLRIIPNNLVIPLVLGGGGWDTGIMLVNTDREPAAFTLRFRQQDGSPLVFPVDGIGSVNEYSDSIPVGGTRVLTIHGSDSALSRGWAELTATRSIGGTATIRQSGPSGETAAEITVAPPLGKALQVPFDYTGGVQTSFVLVNTSSSTSSMSLIFHDEDGDQISTASIVLPSKGQQLLQLSDQIGLLLNRRGVVEIKSSGDGTSAVGLRNTALGGFSSSRPVPSQSSSADTFTRTISRVVDGGGWKTTFVLLNPGSKPAPFSLVFHSSAPGYASALSLLNIGPTREYSDEIPAGGLRVLETTGTAGILVQQWVEIVSTGIVSGDLILTQHRSDGTDSEASVAIVPTCGDRIVIPFDNSTGAATALALLNAGNQDGLSTVLIRDQNGQWLGSQYLPAGAGTSQTFFTSHLFPSTDGLTGSVEISGMTFSVLGLRFSPLGSFVTVSPISK